MTSYQKLFDELRIDAVPREDSLLWLETYDCMAYQSVQYLSSSIDYQLAYQQGHGGEWQDISCVIYSDKRPVALWPLTLSQRDGTADLSSQGRPVLPPAFVEGCPAKTRKRVTASCLKLANQLAKELGLKSWISASQFEAKYALSHWHLMAMNGGATCEVRHEILVDLSLTFAQIKSSFRKSFRSLVTAGEKLWKVEVLSAPGNKKVWEEFRLLHLQVADRSTRSLKTWELQFGELSRDAGFIVELRDGVGSMVGAGYFMLSAHEGVYGVGAYNRRLFDKPLGHVVQFHAIQEMQRRGCRWYNIGRRSFPADGSASSEKELSIAFFKEGFATHVFPSFVFTHPLE